MACRYAGIDWASEKHDVLVADEAGEEVLGGDVRARREGADARCAARSCGWRWCWSRSSDRTGCWWSGCWMRGCGCWRCTRTRSRRRVIGSGSRAGSPIGSTRSCCASWRAPTITASGCSSPTRDQTKAIRALTRAREDLVAARTGIVNQLRAELERFWPGPLRLFSHMDAEILLAFLERYPSPADAHGLGVARMQAFLERERYSGGQHPTALMAKLRSAPRARVGELELAARRQLVLSFVAMIRTLNAQIKDLEREIRTQVRAHPDGPIFLSLFKSPASVITAAELLAEIGDCRERYPTRDALAADAGQAAVADRVRQMEDRRLPTGVQQAPTRRVLPAGGQQPPLAPLGPGPLRPSPPTRPRTPPRDPHPRTRLVPRRVAMLAQPHPIRPRATPRTATPHHRHHPHAVGPRARPRRHPADGRRRCHPTGGPHGPSAKRLTASRHPLPTSGG